MNRNSLFSGRWLKKHLCWGSIFLYLFFSSFSCSILECPQFVFGLGGEGADKWKASELIMWSQGQLEVLKKLHPMARQNTHDTRQTDRHQNFTTESAQWADSVKMEIFITVFGCRSTIKQNQYFNIILLKWYVLNTNKMCFVISSWWCGSLWNLLCEKNMHH